MSIDFFLFSLIFNESFFLFSELPAEARAFFRCAAESVFFIKKIAYYLFSNI